MTKEQQAKEIIENNIYMTIASASKDGKPHISPVFFAYDNKFNLYWTSYKDSTHSGLLRENSQAMIVIFNSNAPQGAGNGVYFDTNVEELSDAHDIRVGIDLLNKRITEATFKISNHEAVTGSSAWRIYRAKPSRISILLDEGEIINGQYVDKRMQIEL